VQRKDAAARAVGLGELAPEPGAVDPARHWRGLRDRRPRLIPSGLAGLAHGAASRQAATVRIDAVVLDCRDAAPLARFWAAALEWRVAPCDEEDLARPAAEALLDPRDAPHGL